LRRSRWQAASTSSITATSRTKARHRRSRRDRKYCTGTWACRRGRPLWSGHCGDCQHQQRDANVFYSLLDVWKLVCKSDQPEEARDRDDRVLHRRDSGALTQKLQHDSPLRRAPAPAATNSCNAIYDIALRNGKSDTALSYAGNAQARPSFREQEENPRQGLAAPHDRPLNGRPRLLSGMTFAVCPALLRRASFRLAGRPCFFNRSLKASSASSWNDFMLSAASNRSSCQVSS